jgi:hypothetical protein
LKTIHYPYYQFSLKAEEKMKKHKTKKEEVGEIPCGGATAANNELILHNSSRRVAHQQFSVKENGEHDG